MSRSPMERAVLLAAAFRPHPNPRVGAVIIDTAGLLVGEGAHQHPGMAHAETAALASAGDKTPGCTMYVTLEPCNHTGRTGPCTAAIIDAGIGRVVVGAIDPDEKVSGAGIAALRKAGIEVMIDESTSSLATLDPGYFHHRRTGRPRFTLKSALTIDGQVAALDGSSQWITGEAARLDGHQLRGDSDGVLVGAGTVFDDDPRLDVRIPGYDGPQPRPIVLSGHREIPSTSRLLNRAALIVSDGAVEQPGEVLVVRSDQDGRLNLAGVATSLGELGFIDVLIEAGPTLAAAMWEAGLIDRGVWYMASKVAGGRGRNVFGGAFRTLSDAADIDIIDVRKVGTDLRIEFVMEG